MKRTIICISLLILSSSANAALLSRLAGQAYYDTVLDITWLADANYAATSGAFPLGMSPGLADTWIASLNAANHLGANDWRLPASIDLDGPDGDALGNDGCDFAYSGTDCGYNVDLSASEMAHLFYSTLGNTAWYDTGGNETGCNASAPYCLTNTGPFSNLLSTSNYWSGPGASSGSRWNFAFSDGGQYLLLPCQGPCLATTGLAWAVRDGDIALAPVPVPAAVWLLASALGVLGIGRRLARD